MSRFGHAQTMWVNKVFTSGKFVAGLINEAILNGKFIVAVI